MSRIENDDLSFIEKLAEPDGWCAVWLALGLVATFAMILRRESALIPVTFGVLFFTPPWKLMRQEALYEWE